jgi:tetratricopeptide (TPR) repeat protein
MYKLFLALFCGLLLMSSAEAASTEDYINAGNNFWSEAKLDKAEIEFKKAIDSSPDSSFAHERLANLYLTMNKSADAVEEFQHAIMLDAENPKLFIGISIAYLHQKYYQMAQAMASRALELDPDLQNAQKLKQYIDAKQNLVSQANSATDSEHADIQETSVQQMGHSLPATVQKSLEDKPEQ